MIQFRAFNDPKKLVNASQFRKDREAGTESASCLPLVQASSSYVTFALQCCCLIELAVTPRSL